MTGLDNVPRRIHFIWFCGGSSFDLTLLQYLSLKSAAYYNPDCKVTLFTDGEPHGPYWDEIKGRIKLERYDSPRKYSYKARIDAPRLNLLYQRGGVYSDLDILFFDNLPDDFFGQKVVVQHDPRPSYIEACFIMSAPEHEVIAEWKKKLVDREATGNTSWAIILDGDDPMIRDRSDVRVLPYNCFCKIFPKKKYIKDLFGRRSLNIEDIVGLHLLQGRSDAPYLFEKYNDRNPDSFFGSYIRHIKQAKL